MSDPVLVIRRPVTTTVVVRRDRALVVTAPGPQGPPGAAGPPGGEAFEYVRTVPAQVWVITHGLGRRVHVSIFTDGAAQVFADVVHGSSNQTSITFASPTTGSAVIS